MKTKLIFTLLICPFFLIAQNETNNTIAILDLEEKGAAPDAVVQQLYRAIEEIVLAQNTWQIVDRKAVESLQAEREKQKGDDYTDAAILTEQGKAVGAQFLLIGEVFHLKQEAKPYEYTNRETQRIERGIKATSTLDASFRLIETETGAIKGTIQLKEKGRAAMSYHLHTPPRPDQIQKLKERSLQDLYKEHAKDFEKWIKEMLPLEMYVLELLEGKKSAKKVLVGGYFSDKRRAYLKVYEHETLDVDGEQLAREALIGYIRVLQIEANGFVVCEVLEGNKDIMKRLTAGATLTCRFR